MGSASTPPKALRCRTIQESDLDKVVVLLRRGFADRSEDYWRRGLARHLSRPLPEGYPKLGYLLEADGEAVGVLLTLYSAVEQDGESFVRCNLSSWYVEPAYRSQGTLLDKVAIRRPEVTYVNVTPAPQTWAIQNVRGFECYCRGQMLVVPALSRTQPGTKVRVVTPDDSLDELDVFERALVQDHLRYGCLCLLGLEERRCTPFVFQRRTIGLLPLVKTIGQVPCFQLIYGDASQDLPRFAGPIGRLLLRRHAMPWIVVDANAKIPGLVGRFFAGRALKYAHGPNVRRIGDLAYTELVLFGP